MIPERPIEDASNWKGSQIQDSEEWVRTISDAEQDEIASAVNVAKSNGLQPEQLTRESFPLPTLGAYLTDLARELDQGRGFELLRGLDTASYNVDDLELMYYGMATYLGKVIPQDNAGVLVGHVRDTGRAYEHFKVRAYQTNKSLSYHNDASDVVALFCLQKAKEGGVSRIVSGTAIHDEVMAIRPDLLRSLYEDVFYFSWKGQGPRGAPPYYKGHIFSCYKGRLSMRLNTGVIYGAYENFPELPELTGRQLEALNLVDEIAHRDEFNLDMSFRPGDIQFLNNYVTLHSRTGFIDSEDESMRRHLLRLWLSLRNGRELEPGFTDRHEQVGAADGYRQLFEVNA